LVDYYTWAQKRDPYNPLETYSIPLAQLKQCINEQNLQLKRGDILFIRSGFIKTYSAIDIPAREAISVVNPPHFAGLEQSEDVLEWIWNQQFAAVAGDAPSFEAWRIVLMLAC
jgi:Putative cyclase